MTDEVVTPEEQAREHGWVPQEEWRGAPDQWRPAKEFNERGEMIGKLIHEQKSNTSLRTEVDELKDSIRILGEHNKKVKEQARTEALEELKNLKKEALRDHDVDSVVEIDDKIADLKATPAEPSAPANSAVVDAWTAENTWYTGNETQAAAFDGILARIVNADPALRDDPKAALAKATVAMKKDFPSIFGSTRTMQTALEPGEPAAQKKEGKYTKGQLSNEQRLVAERMIRQGVPITIDEYAQQLGDLGELGA
jgi:hypothetical protein